MKRFAYVPLASLALALGLGATAHATSVLFTAATLAPGVSCQVWGPVGTMTYCHFTSSSSKVRGVLNVIAANTGVVSSIPASK